MDSVYNLLANKNNKDTIYISEQLFHWAGLRGFDIVKQIESGQCAVVDGNNKRHFLIIRQKVSFYKGPLSAWGGRTYLLPGHETYFCVGMDWIS